MAAASASRSPGRDEQAVLAVAHELRHPADGGRDHRGPDGEGLHDRVREVLPGGGEERGVGRAEEREHAVPVERAEEADAAVERRARQRAPANFRQIRAVPGDRAGSRPSTRTSASSATSSAFCRVIRPANASAARRRRALRAPRRGREEAEAGSRVRQHGDPLLGDAPATASAARYALGQTRWPTRRSARSRAWRSSRTRSPPPKRWNSSRSPSKSPQAPRALVGLVRDELDDDGPPRERRSEDARPSMLVA